MTPKSFDTQTIAAIATPPGRGGIGIIRVSGPLAKPIAQSITGNHHIKNRYAHYGAFYEVSESASANYQRAIDQGITLFFAGPNSFTGEDTVEFQAHGGPVLLDFLLKEIIRLGARLAKPGEFSERAYLNNKIDLAQAEAIADLINSQSEQAARNALRSLQGEFSRLINQLVERVIHLRVYVEAAIDFPEEEIDFLADGKVASDLASIVKDLTGIFKKAQQGTILQEGLTVVIAGKPNAGKSSLLNALSGRDAAIVTDIAGTTRDVLREQIQIDGMPLHIIDTAGLRESPDVVEQEGVRRAWREIESADRILLVVDSTQSQLTDPALLWPELSERRLSLDHLTVILNKCDLSGMPEGLKPGPPTIICMNTKSDSSVEVLRQHLKESAGFQGAGEGGFTARRRHLDALNQALQALQQGQQQLAVYSAGELLAEDLRRCQNALSTITGEFTPDDLLGEIFSSFCIGK